MCLLALINIDSKFTDTELLDFIKSNQDGYGFMRPEVGAGSGGDEIATYKQPTSENFVANFRLWQEQTRAAGQSEFAMHTRMRTHGDVDFHNAHPHKVTDDLWLMHNGILSVSTKSNEKNSDTIHYIEQMIVPLLSHTQLSVWHTPTMLELLGEHIGENNKFILCTSHGFGVVNAAAGITFRGSWFSNTYAWSLFMDDEYRTRREKKYDWKSGYGSFDRGEIDWRKEWLGGAKEQPDVPNDSYSDRISDPYLNDEYAEEIDLFVEEIEYAAEEYYTPSTYPAAWQHKGAYTVEAVISLAHSILSDEGPEGLTNYLDDMYAVLSDMDELALEGQPQ